MNFEKHRNIDSVRDVRIVSNITMKFLSKYLITLLSRIAWFTIAVGTRIIIATALSAPIKIWFASRSIVFYIPRRTLRALSSGNDDRM